MYCTFRRYFPGFVDTDAERECSVSSLSDIAEFCGIPVEELTISEDGTVYGDKFVVGFVLDGCNINQD